MHVEAVYNQLQVQQPEQYLDYENQHKSAPRSTLTLQPALTLAATQARQRAELESKSDSDDHDTQGRCSQVSQFLNRLQKQL